MLAARRSLAVVVSARASRRGVRWRSSNEAEREDDVGRRSAVRPGRRTPSTTTRLARARRGRRRAKRTTRSRLGARSPSSCRLGRAGAGCDGGAATKLSVRMASVGARRCGQDGARRARRRDRRALDEVGGALKERRARGSALARRRRVGSCEPARVRRRSSNGAEREDDVGRRPAVRPGRRTRRTTTRSARVDGVGGAITERRARGSALARRRRVSSSEQARRGQSSNGAESEDDVGRRAALRPERRTLRTTARSVRARQGRRR